MLDIFQFYSKLQTVEIVLRITAVYFGPSETIQNIGFVLGIISFVTMFPL